MAQVSPVWYLESSTPPQSITASPSGLTFFPQPTSTNGPSYTPNVAASSSMYLYTFLATLLILLGVSSAIVLRSIVLRRRQRHIIESAIADGTWMPPRTRQRRNGRSNNLGEKPKMYVAAFGKEESDGDVDGVGKEKMRDEKIENVQWKDVLPVSASYVTPSTNTTPAIPNPPAPTSIMSRISPSQPPSSPPSIHHPTSETKAPLDIPQQLRISVLIAMPSRHPIYTDQEELPPMEIGVAELHCTGKHVDMDPDADDDDDVCN